MTNLIDTLEDRNQQREQALETLRIAKQREEQLKANGARYLAGPNRSFILVKDVRLSGKK